MTTGLKAAGYIRVSTEQQADEGLSLDAQKAAIRKRVEDESWELVELFEDPAMSGRNDERPELQRMLASLGDFDVLIVAKLDRLGRRAAKLLDMYDALEAAKVRLLPLGDPEFDSATATGRMLPRLLAVLSQMEVEQVGERVAATAAQRAVEGRFHGTPPFGYKPKGKGGNLVVDPQAADTVRRIYKDAVAGQSRRQIAKALNAERIATRRGGKWTAYSVGLVIANVTYKGEIPFKGNIYPGQHDALVDADLWKEGQTKSAVDQRRPGPGREPSGRHLFTKGLLRCGFDHAAMRPRKTAAGEETYVCAMRLDNGPDACALSPIKREQIDGAALAYFEDVGLDGEAMKAELLEATQRRRTLINAQLRGAHEDDALATARLDRIRRVFQDEEMDAAEFNLQRDRLVEQIEAAAAEVEQAEQHIAEVVAAEAEAADLAVVKQLEVIRAAVAGKLDGANLATIRRVLRELFESFYIAPIDMGRDKLKPDELELAESSRSRVLESLRKFGSDPIEAGGYTIIPRPRPEALVGLDESFKPILKRRGVAGQTIGKSDRSP